MARSVVFNRAGKPSDVLKVVDIDGPSGATPGKVLVRVTAFPVHPGDLQAIEATTFAHGPREVRPGIEATGVVEAVGAGVREPGLEKGARVTVFPHPGAWSEFLLAAPESVVPVPDALSDDVAAQLLVNPLTALMLRRELEATRAVGYNGLFLQTAAGSSVARLLSADSERHGMAHINIVRRAEQAEALRRLFPMAPAVSTSESGWQDEVRGLAAGRPITGAADPVGGTLAGELLDLLAPGGTLITYGRIAEEPIPVHASKLLKEGLTVRGATIGRWTATTSPEQRAWDVQAAVALATALDSHFVTASRYDLDELSAAVDHALLPAKVGTVLVTMG